MLTISQATKPQLDETLAWLEREDIEAGEGFYGNKDIIVESFAKEQVYCASLGKSAVGFVVHNVMSVGSSIDILEIHPEHRHNGFGTQLAMHAIERLFKVGAPYITVKCAPRSSESFWRRLGFTTYRMPHGMEPLELKLCNEA